MKIEPIPQQRTFGELGFDAFYRRNLAIVYGYVLRLCGGNVDRAQDLTQEAWVAFVDQVRADRADQLDVRWLIAVARNRYIDQWRRTRKLERRLDQVWNATRDCDADDAVTRNQVLEQLAELDDDYRLVLMMRYVDGLPVEEIAVAISRTATETYSLLARARDELRRSIVGTSGGRTDMSDRATAFYDDLAVEPDCELERTLRRRLDHDLRAVRIQPMVMPVDIDLDMPSLPLPEPRGRDERGRSRRSMTAVAAAIAASIAVGAIVDQLVADDSGDPPVATVPTVTSPTATVEVPLAGAPTTTPLFTADDIVAIKTLLWDADYNLPGFLHIAGAPVNFDGLIADRLPACQAFVPTVFESDARPATIQSRLFQNSDDPGLILQYVAVHPTEAQAIAMLDAMQDPAFLDDCVPAYQAALPARCCGDVDVESWFPIETGDEQLVPPVIDVEADDMWIRSYNVNNWDDGEGRIHGPRQFAFAAIRVGRVVTTIDVLLNDSGVQLATTNDFERIVQHMAARAADAQ